MKILRTDRNRLRRFSQWSQDRMRELIRNRADGYCEPGAGKLGDVADLTRTDFGKSFRKRFSDKAVSSYPRKLWELCWLAQKFDDLSLGGAGTTLLGLGVGREPLIFHFAHLADQVIATDLYDPKSNWCESRATVDSVASASPFAYPRERLAVRNMDMRQLDCPAASVDVVWSCSSVEHVSTLAEFVQIFREVHRVLKPGGVALITTEFSLEEPYFLPGVLSLWKNSALFSRPLKGLSLLGSVDLNYIPSAGNAPARRRDVHRHARMANLGGGPSGICIHVGYTCLIPVGFVLQKTSDHFDWPELLDAPAWYGHFAAGVQHMKVDGGAKNAAECFHQALEAADQPGARLHCYRHLVEAQVHSGQAAELSRTLTDIERALDQFPDDDDSLDLIGYVAAGHGRLGFAHDCWERAIHAPGALASTCLRIRHNQLAAEIGANGLSLEAQHLSRLADAASCEAIDACGPDDPQVQLYSGKIKELREQVGLVSLLHGGSPNATPAASSYFRRATSIQDPDFNPANAPPRPIVNAGDNLAITKTVYGHKMYLDTQSQVGACILMDGYWESWIVRHLRNYVKPGMRALDIGANMGFYTLLLCDLVGPQGQVVAFEPWKRYYDIVRRNVELNGFQQRCIVENKAVGAAVETKELVFFENYGTGACSSCLGDYFEDLGVDPDALKKGSKVPVPVVSLDEYFAEDTRPIDFIKLDIDGFEPFAFEGMTRILARQHPMAVFCEFTPDLFSAGGVDPIEFLKRLQSFGFRISEMSPQGIQPMASLPSTVEEGLTLTGNWTELLLVRD